MFLWSCLLGFPQRLFAFLLVHPLPYLWMILFLILFVSTSESESSESELLLLLCCKTFLFFDSILFTLEWFKSEVLTRSFSSITELGSIIIVEKLFTEWSMNSYSFSNKVSGLKVGGSSSFDMKKYGMSFLVK